MEKAEKILYKHCNDLDVGHIASKSFTLERVLDAINEALSQHDVSKRKFVVEWVRNVNYGVGSGTEYFMAESKEDALKLFWEGKNKEAFDVNTIYVC